MDLSIIIPTFDEARKIRRDVTAAAEFLAAHMGRGEIIVSDDGSRDGTLEVARAVRVPADIAFRVLVGASQRERGRRTFRYWRIDLRVRDVRRQRPDDPVRECPTGPGPDRQRRLRAAHGSRKLLESVIRIPQQSDRKVSSALFRALLGALFPVPRHLTDTQCGFKVYRGDVARRLYGECVIDGFLDVEVILRAQHQGCRILEFPIEWSCDRDSRLTFRRSSWPILQELLALKRVVSSWPPARPKR